MGFEKCKNCSEREVGCHSKCEYYLNKKELIEKERKIRNKKREMEEDFYNARKTQHPLY